MCESVACVQAARAKFEKVVPGSSSSRTSGCSWSSAHSFAILRTTGSSTTFLRLYSRLHSGQYMRSVRLVFFAFDFSRVAAASASINRCRHMSQKKCEQGSERGERTTERQMEHLRSFSRLSRGFDAGGGEADEEDAAAAADGSAAAAAEEEGGAIEAAAAAAAKPVPLASSSMLCERERWRCDMTGKGRRLAAANQAQLYKTSSSRKPRAGLTSQIATDG